MSILIARHICLLCLVEVVDVPGEECEGWFVR
jgi:hypothetical protein